MVFTINDIFFWSILNLIRIFFNIIYIIEMLITVNYRIKIHKVNENNKFSILIKII